MWDASLISPGPAPVYAADVRHIPAWYMINDEMLKRTNEYVTLLWESGECCDLPVGAVTAVVSVVLDCSKLLEGLD